MIISLKNKNNDILKKRIVDLKKEKQLQTD